MFRHLFTLSCALLSLRAAAQVSCGGGMSADGPNAYPIQATVNDYNSALNAICESATAGAGSYSFTEYWGPVQLQWELQPGISNTDCRAAYIAVFEQCFDGQGYNSGTYDQGDGQWVCNNYRRSDRFLK
jgi:hypothetical protein